SLHAEQLNPAIAFDALGLTVAREALALPATGALYAGVNSFGWGGTNAHVILAPAPERAPVIASRVDAPLVVPVSAHNDAALRQRIAELAALAGEVALEDLAGTLAWRRDHQRCRVAVVAETAEALATRLAALVAQ